MNIYTLKLTDYNNKITYEEFKSRKQAYVYITSTMFMKNKYQQALLYNSDGEIWLSIDYRGRDGYFSRRRVWKHPFYFILIKYFSILKYLINFL